MNIQWYPGHMAKAKRKILETIKLVDVVIEILDARIPYSSRNPDMDELARGKFRIVVLNKADLADSDINLAWKSYFEEKGIKPVMANSIKGSGLERIYPAATELMEEKIQRQKARGRISVPIRAMVAGIPNSGKSTFINKLHGKSIAKTGDRPGVTKANQWIKIKKDFELLDTPGILWPKFEDEEVGKKLAFTGAISDVIMDLEGLSIELIKELRESYPDVLGLRYGIEFSDTDENYAILEMIGKSRGFLMKGQKIDLKRTSIILLDEFRGGTLGKISLEKPDN
ncbi:MAG: ribosome biogenesis GTPase YlqF [Defluviitaleaceae bacterium]|nr:ribosome biogenesis GTPase YlqF [Defluviitaleaceae bacterium]